MTIVPALNKVMFVEVMESSEKLPKRFPPEDSFEALVSLDKIHSPLVIRGAATRRLYSAFRNARNGQTEEVFAYT